MKYIQKQPQPQLLIAWIHGKSTDDDGNEQQWNYKNMPADVRAATKKSLLREQGGLCCYTGQRITADTSHIEHIKPQSECIGHEDTDYDNLVVAYPSSESGTPECAYGARKKDKWYKEELFVHPRRKDCEARFRYRTTGKVIPANNADSAVAITIEKLRLDHPELEQMRKAAIVALDLEELSEAKARRLMAAMNERDKDGNFRPFCFVIKQACEKYLKRFAQPKSKH